MWHSATYRIPFCAIAHGGLAATVREMVLPCLIQEADFHERLQHTSFHTLITTTPTIPPSPLLQKGCKWCVVQCQDWGGAKLLDGKGHCAPRATPQGHSSLVCWHSVPELFSCVAGSAEGLLSLTFSYFIYATELLGGPGTYPKIKSTHSLSLNLSLSFFVCMCLCLSLSVSFSPLGSQILGHCNKILKSD